MISDTDAIKEEITVSANSFFQVIPREKSHLKNRWSFLQDEPYFLPKEENKKKRTASGLEEADSF